MVAVARLRSGGRRCGNTCNSTVILWLNVFCGDAFGKVVMVSFGGTVFVHGTWSDSDRLRKASQKTNAQNFILSLSDFCGTISFNLTVLDVHSKAVLSAHFSRQLLGLLQAVRKRILGRCFYYCSR